MKIDPIFSTVFRKLYNQPCWNVKPGFGSFMTFEFGQPHLEIREPIESKEIVSPKVKKNLARRSVYIHGEWHLWIYCCEWVVYSTEKFIGDSSSKQSIKKAAEFLDGQKLVDVVIVPRGNRSSFIFDLGGKLETKPYDRKSEQWMLYEPSGYVLTLGANKKYSYNPGNITCDSTKWRNVVIE